VHKYSCLNDHTGRIFSTLHIYNNRAVYLLNLVAGDISRRKKVKEKRPSPFLFCCIGQVYEPLKGKYVFFSK